MKLRVLWVILNLFMSHICFAQTEPDLSSLEEMSDLALDKTTGKNKLSPKENLNDQSKKISLRNVIETGLRKNNFEQTRQYQKEILKLDFKNDYDSFWFPQLSLTFNTQETLVDNLYTDVVNNNGTSKTPNGYIGLEFENYTLFNWGKDYLDFQNSKSTFKRAKKSLSEQRRKLRFSLIAQYFNLSRAKRVLQIKKSQLRHTSFMYRLAKEKITLKKITGQHYLQTKAEFLRSHSEYQKAFYDVAEQESEMAKQLGDDLTTSYTPTEQLKFTPLTTGRSESYKYALRLSPEYLEAKTRLENANRSYQKALKENMPLPKFDLKLGAFKHQFSSAGAQDQFGQANGNRNIEVVASINMTWKIFGSGGLLNQRVQDKSYLNKRISEIGFTEAKRNTSTLVNTYHRKIRFLEKQIEANLAFVKNARKTFDRTLDNYISGKTSFPDIKIVLDSLIMSEVAYETSKYQHIVVKLQLAHLMGLDDFPGDSFEKMVMK